MVLSIGSYYSFTPKPDAEWQRIIELLWDKYGIRSSGSKAIDRQILHEHELKEAKKETSVSINFLTVTKAEQEKIQAEKMSQKAETELRTNDDSTKGADILGKQIFQAIQMKNEQDKEEYCKKRNNKYQS